MEYYCRNCSLLKQGILKYIKLFKDEKKKKRKGTEGQKEISLYSATKKGIKARRWKRQ